MYRYSCSKLLGHHESYHLRVLLVCYRHGNHLGNLHVAVEYLRYCSYVRHVPRKREKERGFRISPLSYWHNKTYESTTVEATGSISVRVGIARARAIRLYVTDLQKRNVLENIEKVMSETKRTHRHHRYSIA